MKVTLKLLREWGATCNLDWFEKRYPLGFEGTAKEIAEEIADREYDQWWILVEMAVRLSDKDGADALRLATERVDPSRLAALAIRVKDKDTGEAMTKLCASKDLLALKQVVDRAAKSELAAQAQAVLDAELAAKEAV
jgi:hypothetical protein